VASELQQPSEVGWVKALVAEATNEANFKPLPSGDDKGSGLYLLEMCVDPLRRQEAILALRQLRPAVASGEQTLVNALVECGSNLEGVTLCEDHSSWMQRAPSATESERASMEEAVVASATPVKHFVPATTSAGKPCRHPWDGFLGQVTFGELSAGIGMFAACFEAAGAVCSYLVEPDVEMRGRAARVCRGRVLQYDSLMAVDPADLPWVHVLVAGTECQPFSKRGHRAAWGDDRAYTLIRAIHVAAVQQPWLCWFENVANILSLHEGRVLEAIEGMAEAAGFVLRVEEA
jgi:hypothetical protein